MAGKQIKLKNRVLIIHSDYETSHCPAYDDKRETCFFSPLWEKNQKEGHLLNLLDCPGPESEYCPLEDYKEE